MMGLGEGRAKQWTKKNCGNGEEEMSCDSIKTHQTLFPGLSVSLS